jgi:hypothetical protein
MAINEIPVRATMEFDARKRRYTTALKDLSIPSSGEKKSEPMINIHPNTSAIPVVIMTDVLKTVLLSFSGKKRISDSFRPTLERVPRNRMDDMRAEAMPTSSFG